MDLREFWHRLVVRNVGPSSDDATRCPECGRTVPPFQGVEPDVGTGRCCSQKCADDRTASRVW